eukprot:TRINITY_DN37416_c0_g2_i3.p1 TRINITY_DN37416_c0_g2~~TRINITY_DN37416_c0_g2_i3.p1  ORF type:complete len:225 (+),score=10.72 TRINITY_DN37416_c0_g2_i3:314-988(+)
MPKKALVRRSSIGRLNSSTSAVVHGPSCLCFACLRRARETLKCSQSVKQSSQTPQYSGYSSPDEEPEGQVFFPRRRGKSLSARVTPAWSDFVLNSPSPLHTTFDAVEQSPDRFLPEEEPGFGSSSSVSVSEEHLLMQDESTVSPGQTGDSATVLGAERIVKAWEIILRRGDASLLQQTVPTAMESLWNPSAETSTGARPTLELFQRFSDGLPAMFRASTFVTAP